MCFKPQALCAFKMTVVSEQPVEQVIIRSIALGANPVSHVIAPKLDAQVNSYALVVASLASYPRAFYWLLLLLKYQKFRGVWY